MCVFTVLNVYLTLLILLTSGNLYWSSVSPSATLALLRLVSGSGMFLPLLHFVANLFIPDQTSRPRVSCPNTLYHLCFFLALFISCSFTVFSFIVSLPNWARNSTGEGLLCVSSPLSPSTLHVDIQRLSEKNNERLTSLLHVAYSFRISAYSFRTVMEMLSVILFSSKYQILESLETVLFVCLLLGPALHLKCRFS